MRCPKCGSDAPRIGISDGDSVGYWRCPDCKHEIPRAGGNAEFARRNIDKWRQQDAEQTNKG